MTNKLPIAHDTACGQLTLSDLTVAFYPLADAYAKTWGIHCVLVDTHGQVVAGQVGCAQHCANSVECTTIRQQAVDESVRWGEPFTILCPQGSMVWAVPVMENAVLLGGLVAAREEAAHIEGESSSMSTADIHRAALDLLALAEEANVTNSALLELRRLAAHRESERAEAIHALKGQNYQSIRELYLVEEPALIAAIKRGDRHTAREILNRVLIGIYFLGRERPLLLKSFILELIVTMSRSAVEAGGDPTELLGANFSSVADLARIESEEELCAWLVSMLERMMDAIKSNHHYPISVLLGSALTYMQEHLQDDISRDDVAKVACLSPTHFSRVAKQTFGHSFTELLARMRVDRAREMLVISEKSLIQIGLECGFSDQSYFTKVFQKYVGRTPGEYRRLHRSTT
ncbi:MAG TPA: helix-turn-helix domain-containing protein [Armatimonadota bacterium]|jgi:AraC-like DNA-binding protein/ligand-binding sensor protein